MITCNPECADREESEQAWKVSVEQIKANGYNLDIKNPNTVADDLGDPDEMLAEYNVTHLSVCRTTSISSSST